MKVLKHVALTERLAVPLAGQPPASYRLYAIVVHAGSSLDSGHFFAFCRGSGSGGAAAVDDGWWRLDDTSAVPVPAATALGRLRRPNEAAYVLLYRLEEPAAAVGGRTMTLAALPDPLRAAVERDNALYRRERRGRRRVSTLWNRRHRPRTGYDSPMKLPNRRSEVWRANQRQRGHPDRVPGGAHEAGGPVTAPAGGTVQRSSPRTRLTQRLGRRPVQPAV